MFCSCISDSLGHFVGLGLTICLNRAGVEEFERCVVTRRDCATLAQEIIYCKDQAKTILGSFNSDIVRT